MKALILAAGLGTRLRPLTNSIPKALILIAEKPLLQYHLELLGRAGINEIIINTHYLSNKINQFVDEYRGTHRNLKITTSFEPNLLGTAGALRANEDFFSTDENFIVVCGDNFTNINYSPFITFHNNHHGVATIGCYFEPHPESKGIIVFDSNKKIEQFKEKPAIENIVSNWASGGIYMFNRNIFNYLNQLAKLPLDFAYDVFPALINAKEKMYAYEIPEILLDVGTPETYLLAQNLAQKI